MRTDKAKRGVTVLCVRTPLEDTDEAWQKLVEGSPEFHELRSIKKLDYKDREVHKICVGPLLEKAIEEMKTQVAEDGDTITDERMSRTSPSPNDKQPSSEKSPLELPPSSPYHLRTRASESRVNNSDIYWMKQRESGGLTLNETKYLDPTVPINTNPFMSRPATPYIRRGGPQGKNCLFATSNEDIPDFHRSVPSTIPQRYAGGARAMTHIQPMSSSYFLSPGHGIVPPVNARYCTAQRPDDKESP